jgi:hypothetical protein
MKTVKRVFAVVFLVLLIWAIGYLVHTGSRLFSNDSNEEAYRGTFFQANNKEYFLEITKELDANLYHNGMGKGLIYKSFADGVLTYLDGNATLDEALDKLKQHTRNYAKRQLTWFRSNPHLNINI